MSKPKSIYLKDFEVKLIKNLKDPFKQNKAFESKQVENSERISMEDAKNINGKVLNNYEQVIKTAS